MNAGSTTSSGILQFLVLILTSYPHVQQKAHDELDRVVGHERAPVLDDLRNLPYVHAVIKEVWVILAYLLIC